MGLINRLLFRLTVFMPCRLIRNGDAPYLERYYVGRLFGVTFYLHRFLSEDREEHLHNHPWGWGRSLVLSGAYDEQVVRDFSNGAPGWCVTDTRRVRWWNRVNGNHFHRISNAAPGTWTLFFHGARLEIGGRLKGWGFLSPKENCLQFEACPVGDLEWFKYAQPGWVSGREPLQSGKGDCS